MSINRSWSAYSFLDENLSWCVGNTILASYNVSNISFKIVYYNSQMINWVIYISSNNKIAKLCCIKCHGSPNKVIKCDSNVWIFKTHNLFIFSFSFLGYIGLSFINQSVQIFVVYFNPFR